MPWTQVSLKRWERPLNGIETYFRLNGKTAATLCGGRERFLILSTVKVKLNLPTANIICALRNAWTQLRHEEPDLAVTFEDMNNVYRYVYESPDNAELQAWLDRTFIVSDTSNAKELYGQERHEFKQTTLHFLPKSDELFILTHHAVIDGVGLELLWDRYFMALSTPKDNIVFGDEYTRLAPPMEEALGYEKPAPTAIEKANAMLMNEYISRLPGIGIPSRVGKTAPGACRSIEKRLSVETTDAVVKACKARGISVTAAVHAAYVCMLMKYADPDPASSTRRYTAPVQFNLRPLLDAPYSSTGVGNYFAGFPLSIDLPSSFAEIAKKLNEYYNRVKGDREMMQLNGPFTQALVAMVSSPEAQDAPIPTDAQVSSLGVVERYLRREYGDGGVVVVVVVEDYNLALDIVLGMNAFHVFTFRDCLRLVYSFNDAYEEPVDIGRYLDEIEVVIGEELLE